MKVTPAQPTKNPKAKRTRQVCAMNGLLAMSELRQSSVGSVSPSSSRVWAHILIGFCLAVQGVNVGFSFRLRNSLAQTQCFWFQFVHHFLG
jgi:hypothetical protein